MACNIEDRTLILKGDIIGAGLDSENTSDKSQVHGQAEVHDENTADACTKLVNEMVLEEEIIDINHEMEVDFEHEADLPQRYKSCKKNPGHLQFIPVNAFSLSHLPPEYQTKDFLDLIQSAASLTVRLKVRGCSEHRPTTMPGTSKPYPFSSVKERKLVRAGSGWVYSAKIIENKDCPCRTCQESGSPKQQWGLVYIETAAHVVFDKIEGNNTLCYFFYDSDETVLETCPFLNEPIIVTSSVKNDTSTIQYATHDISLVNHLREILSCYTVKCCKVKEKYVDNYKNECDNDMLNMISTLLARISHALPLLDRLITKLKSLLASDIDKEWNDYLSKHRDKTLNLLGYIIVDKLKGGQRAVITLDFLSLLYEECIKIQPMLTDFQTICGQYTIDESSKNKMLETITLFRSKITATERQLNYFKVILNEEEVEDFPSEKPLFNTSHTLTFIVSHPHGCSKKITIGHIAEREKVGMGQGIASQYKYNNPTCPGSSGARVFTLGKAAFMLDHPHSGQSVLRGAQGQVNKSAVYLDF